MDPTILIVLAVAALVLIAIVAVVVLRRRQPVSGDQSTAPVAAPRGLRDRLDRSRTNLAGALGSVFSSPSPGADEWESLEDALITADVGPATALEVVDAVRRKGPGTGGEARAQLVEELVAVLDGPDRSLSLASHPSVVVVVGVNGTGKTTSIAKIAHDLVRNGKGVVLGAADTFRAAADAQLRAWGARVGVPVVTGEAGADPASVAFESFQRAVSDDADVVIVDTAGRLHSQMNLMEELGKVVRVLGREAGEVNEVLLVLDGTVGQNGIAQARAFTEAVGVTGIVLTKLDGTSKGGIAIAVERELRVPVKLIGVGEGMDDLIPFVPRDFVEALIAP